MLTELKVKAFMTYSPHTINSGVPIKKAKEMMRKYDIRHLPVQSGGKLMGVITDRDLKLATSFGDEESLRVEEIMTEEPYTVDPEAPLGKVAEKMATNKLGCAVVQGEDGKVVGIFTAIDGLRAISNLSSDTGRQG